MSPLSTDLLYLLLALGVIWTVIWLFIVTRATQSAPEEIVAAHSARLRRRLVFPLLGVLLVALLVSLYWLPYPDFRGRTMGKPTMTINVSALQWGWVVSQTKIPAHTPVEFVLTSRDVNHDFAIYGPKGDLLTQAQVMPGYSNRLIYEFDQPGTYTIRCLEYCGLGHDGMLTRLSIA